jgi:septal ring factor EnvC (AmiA/AmiB activator)
MAFAYRQRRKIWRCLIMGNYGEYITIAAHDMIVDDKNKRIAALERELAETQEAHGGRIVECANLTYKVATLERELKAAEDHAASMEASCRETEKKLAESVPWEF